MGSDFNLDAINQMMRDKFSAKPTPDPSLLEEDPIVKEALRKLMEREQQEIPISENEELIDYADALNNRDSNCIECGSEDIITWSSLKDNVMMPNYKCNGCEKQWQ